MSGRRSGPPRCPVPAQNDLQSDRVLAEELARIISERDPGRVRGLGRQQTPPADRATDRRQGYLAVLLRRLWEHRGNGARRPPAADVVRRRGPVAAAVEGGARFGSRVGIRGRARDGPSRVSDAWLDGPTALAAVIDRSGGDDAGDHDLAGSSARPVPLAKTLAALEVLSGRRLVAGIGPGSSKRDYDAVGGSCEDRWTRFDEAVMILRALLRDEPVPERRV